MAARRALTLLSYHPKVDRERLGIFGVSVGGTLCWLVAATDERVKTSVPIYGCGYNYDQKKTVWGFPEPNPALSALQPRAGSGGLRASIRGTAAVSGRDERLSRLDGRRLRYPLANACPASAGVSRRGITTTSTRLRPPICRPGWIGNSRADPPSRRIRSSNCGSSRTRIRWRPSSPSDARHVDKSRRLLFAGRKTLRPTGIWRHALRHARVDRLEGESADCSSRTTNSRRSPMSTINPASASAPILAGGSRRRAREACRWLAEMVPSPNRGGRRTGRTIRVRQGEYRSAFPDPLFRPTGRSGGSRRRLHQSRPLRQAHSTSGL